MDPGAPSYIERSADAPPARGAARGRVMCSCSTRRQKGKSSLVCAHPRQAEGARRPDRQSSTCSALAPKANRRSNGTPDCLLGIGQELGCTPQLFEHWATLRPLGHSARGSLRSRTVALPDLPAPLVVFVDEVDFVRALPFPTDEFFGASATAYNRRTNERDVHPPSRSAPRRRL